MNDQKLLRKVMSCTKEDPWCQECLERVNQHEEAFWSMRSKLTETEQEHLDLYIGACEAFCDSRIFAAYQLGMEQSCQVSATENAPLFATRVLCEL